MADDLFDGNEILADILGRAKSVPAIERYLNNEYGFLATERGLDLSELAKDIYDLGKEANTLPMEYFEAKTYRAFPFGEAAGIVVPDSLPNETQKKLSDLGANVLTYKDGDNEDRLRVVNGIAGARFSKSIEYNDFDGALSREQWARFYAETDELLEEGNLRDGENLYFAEKTKNGKECIILYDFDSASNKRSVFFAVQSASSIDTPISQIKEGFESGRYKVRDVGFQIIKCLTEDKLQRYNSIDGTYSGYSAPDRREDGDNRRNIGYGGIGHAGEGVSSRNQEDAGVSDYRRTNNYEGQLSLEDSVSPRDEFMEGFHAFWEKARASGVWYQQDWLDLLKEHPAYDFVNRITKEGDSNVNKKVKLATFRSLPEIIERGTLLEDDADNYHKADSSVKYAYIEAEVLIDGKPFAITVSIRKSAQKNLFWVHSVDIKRTARQAGSPYGLSRAKKSNGSKQSLQRKGKKVKRNVRYSREVSGTDAMRFVDAFYTRDTVKPSVDDRVVEINREWLLDQFDAGRYYAIASHSRRTQRGF